MAGQQADRIGRRVSIPHREIGSRRVSSDDMKAFIQALQPRFLDKDATFKIWRFGHDDQLEYPSHLVHTTINDYDVSRLNTVSMLHIADKFFLSLEIDLQAGYGIAPTDVIVINGPKDLVDTAVATIKEEMDRWPKTWHGRFHFPKSSMFLLGFLIGAIFPLLLYFKDSVTLPRVIFFAAVLYLISFAAFVLAKGQNWVPYFWFYRAGGLIEERRRWLPRLSVGAGFTIVIAILANFMTQAIQSIAN